jgi:hypothetical protein
MPYPISDIQASNRNVRGGSESALLRGAAEFIQKARQKRLLLLKFSFFFNKAVVARRDFITAVRVAAAGVIP